MKKLCILALLLISAILFSCSEEETTKTDASVGDAGITDVSAKKDVEVKKDSTPKKDVVAEAVVDSLAKDVLKE